MSTEEHGVNDEREELVIGRALDALDTVDADLTDDADVREYLEVLSYLPLEEITPPAALEQRVLDAARQRRKADVPSLVSRRRKTARIAVLGTAAAVAAAVGLVIVTEKGTTTRTQAGAISHLTQQVVLGEKHNEYALKDANGVTRGTLAVASNGKHDAALVDMPLESTPETTYWLWIEGASNSAPVATVDKLRTNGFTFTTDLTKAFITAEKPGPKPATPGHVVATASIG
jgi:hypothetical protein